MKIPRAFSQPKDRNILLIAAGKQNAVTYKAEHDSVKKLFSVKIPKPKYSDNEGIFQKSVHGRMVSGSIEIHNDEPIVRDFLHELEKRMKDIKEDVSDVYIFAPPTTKNKIASAFPKRLANKVRRVIEGNYYRKSPMFLIEKISRAERGVFVPRKKSERKILAKAEQAKVVVRDR